MSQLNIPRMDCWRPRDEDRAFKVENSPLSVSDTNKYLIFTEMAVGICNSDKGPCVWDGDPGAVLEVTEYVINSNTKKQFEERIFC